MVATFNDRRRVALVAPNTTSTRRKTLGCYFPTIGVVLVPTLPIAKHLPFASLALDVPRPGGRARRHMAPAYSFGVCKILNTGYGARGAPLRVHTRAGRFIRHLAYRTGTRLFYT